MRAGCRQTEARGASQPSVFPNYPKSPSPPRQTVYTDAINLLLQLFTLWKYSSLSCPGSPSPSFKFRCLISVKTEPTEITAIHFSRSVCLVIPLPTPQSRRKLWEGIGIWMLFLIYSSLPGNSHESKDWKHPFTDAAVLSSISTFSHFSTRLALNFTTAPWPGGAALLWCHSHHYLHCINPDWKNTITHRVMKVQLFSAAEQTAEDNVTCNAPNATLAFRVVHESSIRHKRSCNKPVINLNYTWHALLHIDRQINMGQPPRRAPKSTDWSTSAGTESAPTTGQHYCKNGLLEEHTCRQRLPIQ